jgi:hypothetical protein
MTQTPTVRAELQNGQTWQMKDASLEISLVGKHLVHYKLIRGETKRTPTSLSGIKVVQKFLKEKKAVLVER